MTARGWGFEVMGPQEVMVWAVPSLCGLLPACACPAPWRELMHCSKCLVASPNARDFAERDLWNMSSRLDHSGFAPENLITLPHFSVSSAISLPKSAGESASTSPPRSTMRAFIRGSARAALISLLSLSITSTGVFLGAPMPYHKLASKPGKNSATVGMSGSASERVAVVSDSARSLPALMYSIEEDRSGHWWTPQKCCWRTSAPRGSPNGRSWNIGPLDLIRLDV